MPFQEKRTSVHLYAALYAMNLAPVLESWRALRRQGQAEQLGHGESEYTLTPAFENTTATNVSDW